MLLLFTCILMNFFFAIVDRIFITRVGEVEFPKVNWRGGLRPFFGRIIPCVDWERDLEFETDRTLPLKKKPASRKKVVEDTKRDVQRILAPLTALKMAGGTDAETAGGDSVGIWIKRSSICL